MFSIVGISGYFERTLVKPTTVMLLAFKDASLKALKY